MATTRRRHHLLAISVFLVLSAAAARTSEAQEQGCGCAPSDPCDATWLARAIAEACVENQEQPAEECCTGVIASVGIRFGNEVEVPCLCRVVKEPPLLGAAGGLDIRSILRMYHICGGVHPVGSHTAEACNGRV